MSWQGLALAFRAELFMTLRSWKMAMLIIAPAIASALHLVLIKINHASASLQQSLSGRPQASEPDYAYGYFVDSVSTGLILIYFLFMARAAYTFAIDRDYGVIRHAVIRQSSRRAIVTAKTILLHGITLISFMLMLLVSLCVCALLWDFGPVVEDGYELISATEIHREIREGLVLALLPLPACLCLGILLSVLANSALQAVSMGLGITLLLDVFKGVLGTSAHYIYLSYQPSLLDKSYLKEVSRIVRGFSDILVDEHLMQLNYWLPLPQALVFFILVMLLIKRKNL